MKSIKDKIVARIYGRGRGSIVSASDFLADFKRGDIDEALSQVCKSGTIERVMHGIYHYPEWSDLLQQNLSPDPDRVAQAIARKYGWNIQPTGNTALNYLGLSTQIPGKMLYLSDGPSRKYSYGKQQLEFKHKTLKEARFKHSESALIVHALKALGKEHITEEKIDKIKTKISPDIWEKILKDTDKVTGWVRAIILSICNRT